jgi:arylsulfatase A-like enzyme
MQPWFADRSAAPDIPSSAPALLPSDAVVVMLTIDSLRADVIASNANRAALPNLLRLRDEGVYFERARSPGSGTRIALGAVFTGKHFSQLRWSDPLANRPRLDVDRSARFPELLARAGAATITYACEPALKSAVGIARGFAEETWFDPLPGQKYGLSKEIMAEATARLRAHKGGPLFLYIHLMDPHAPYDAAGTQGAPRERYMREVALVDKAIGELLRALDEAGLAGRAALVITADHGEAFGQHNTPHHNNTLYEELLRVPLIVRVPGVPARRVEQPVSLIDLGPTVLDLMGLPTPGSFMGESLVPFLRGQSPALTRPIIAERRYAQAMVFPDDVKVILDWQKGTEELYDLTRDPSETKNLCDELGPACAARVDVLRAFFLEHARWR